MLSSKGQASLERFGFGTLDEVKNPAFSKSQHAAGNDSSEGTFSISS